MIVSSKGCTSFYSIVVVDTKLKLIKQILKSFTFMVKTDRLWDCLNLCRLDMVLLPFLTRPSFFKYFRTFVIYLTSGFWLFGKSCRGYSFLRRLTSHTVNISDDNGFSHGPFSCLFRSLRLPSIENFMICDISTDHLI